MPRAEKSKIILSKNIKLDKSYNNVLDYTTEQMLTMCRENIVTSAENYSFIRHQNTIHTNFIYNECLQANYIAFQNPDYSNKWFFAFIDDVVYVSDKNTELHYTLDVWSTFFEDWQVNKCIVEREHVADDTVGLHTLNENLNVEEVIQEKYIEDLSFGEYFWVAVETAWIPKGSEYKQGDQYSGVTIYNKTIFANKIVLFSANDITELYRNLGLFLLRVNGDAHIADIKNMFIVPDALISIEYLESKFIYVGEETDDRRVEFYEMKANTIIPSFELDVEKITEFNDFKPKNNKCFCFPYNYIFVSNNIGNSNIYKYENFLNDIKFKFEGVISIGCSGKLIPLNYKGMSRNDDEGIPLPKYPTCAWSSDAFINWITQNALNEATNLAFGIFGASNQYASDIKNINTHNQQVQETGKGTMQSSTAASINLGVNIAGTISRQIGNFYSGSLMPNIQGGQNTADVNWANNRNTFTIRCMRAKTECLKIIDDYFTRFGYKICENKIPNINSRKIFNYIQIADGENVGYGSVQSKYMNTINSICRRGVTIWHNYKNIGNYELDNSNK